MNKGRSLVTWSDKVTAKMVTNYNTNELRFSVLIFQEKVCISKPVTLLHVDLQSGPHSLLFFFSKHRPFEKWKYYLFKAM